MSRCCRLTHQPVVKFPSMTTSRQWWQQAVSKMIRHFIVEDKDASRGLLEEQRWQWISSNCRLLCLLRELSGASHSQPGDGHFFWLLPRLSEQTRCCAKEALLNIYDYQRMGPGAQLLFGVQLRWGEDSSALSVTVHTSLPPHDVDITCTLGRSLEEVCSTGAS